MRPESVQEFLARRPEPKREIVKLGVLEHDSVLILWGATGVGKSWIAMKLGWSVACGRNWMGFQTVPHRVLLLNTEIPRESYQERVRAYAKLHGVPDGLSIVTDLERKLDTPKGLTELAEEIEISGADVVVLDPLYLAMAGDMTKAPDMQRFLDSLNKLRSGKPLAFVIVNHSVKAQTDMFGERVERGSNAMAGYHTLADFADTIIEVRSGVEYNSPPKEVVTLAPQKFRRSPALLTQTTWAVARDRLDYDFLRIGDERGERRSRSDREE